MMSEHVNTDNEVAAVVQRLTPREREEAAQLARELEADDPTSVTRFGSAIQEEIADFAGTLLSQIRSSQGGRTGEMITELVATIQDMPLEMDITPSKKALRQLPLFGRWVGGARKALAQTRSIEAQVEQIRARLDEAYVMLQKDIELLEVVIRRNYVYFKQLELHIAALQLRLETVDAEERPLLKSKLDKATEADPWIPQQLTDLEAFRRRLALRLDDFKRTRFLSLQQAPRIRLMQQGEQLMMEKIQSVMHNLIPLWKMDLVAALAQERVDRAVQLHDEVTRQIEASMRQSAERTRELSVQIAATSEQGLVSMGTLRSVHQELLATLEETAGIYKEGREQREAAEVELQAMEQELKLRLASVLHAPEKHTH